MIYLKYWSLSLVLIIAIKTHAKTPSADKDLCPGIFNESSLDFTNFDCKGQRNNCECYAKFAEFHPAEERKKNKKKDG